MNISKRGSRQYPKLKGGHHSKLSQEGLHPKCSIGKCTLSRLSKFLNVGMSMFQLIFRVSRKGVCWNQGNMTISSQTLSNNEWRLNTSSRVLQTWNHPSTILRMRSLTQSNQTMMVRLHLRLKQMDSQLNNHYKFRGYVQSDTKFLKNCECSNVGILCAQNVQSS